MEVFAILCDRGSAAYWKSLQIPVISSAHPCATPIVTRGEGSFSYQGVSTRGVRHSPGAVKHRIHENREMPKTTRLWGANHIRQSKPRAPQTTGVEIPDFCESTRLRG